MEVGLEDVQEFFAKNSENEDVKNYLSELGVGTGNGNGEELAPEVLEKKIEEDETWKKWFLSRTDKRVSDAIKTHDVKWEDKVKRIQKEAENEVMERLAPKQTPEQKRLAEMELKMATVEKERHRDKMLIATQKYASMYGLSDDIKGNIEFFVHDDEDKIKEHFEFFKQAMEYKVDEGKNSILKKHAYEPVDGLDDEKLPYDSIDSYSAAIERKEAQYDPSLYRKIVERQNRKR